MRKVLWCGSIAGILTASSFLSLTYYACRYPDSLLGRGMASIADAALSMPPISGLALFVTKTHTDTSAVQENGGNAEECVPEDPKPVALEKVLDKIIDDQLVERRVEVEEIIVPEDEGNEGEVVQAAGALMEMNDLCELPARNCPAVMPTCQDGEERSMTPPHMPMADEVATKPADVETTKVAASDEEAEKDVFSAWKKLFGEEKTKSRIAEELPYPTEEEAEPKCEEDSHRHEQYPGCPRATSSYCPYTGKSYPSVPSKSAGKEESSEEPKDPFKQPHSLKGVKGEDDSPHPAGVDTMEFRKSDAGLNEYGPGPVH